jgi:3-hydroxyacyl-[acyl-carrier-protein] dehydratase
MLIGSIPVNLLPHRGAALLIESAELVGENEIIGYQMIPEHNTILAGHFPDFPLWPGTLLVEAMAQVTALLHLHITHSVLAPDQLPILGAVEARFLAPVLPGDRLVFRARLVRRLNDSALFSVSAERDSYTVARGRISAAITARTGLRQIDVDR